MKQRYLCCRPFDDHDGRKAPFVEVEDPKTGERRYFCDRCHESATIASREDAARWATAHFDLKHTGGGAKA